MEKVKISMRRRLEKYSALQRRIEMQQERLATLQSTSGDPSHSRLSGMPRGGGVQDKICRRMETEEALQEKIQAMRDTERQERCLLESMIDKIDNPNEQLVLQMKYFDLIEWPDVCVCLFGGREDFFENEEKYSRKVYRLHTNALGHLEMMDEQ